MMYVMLCTNKGGIFKAIRSSQINTNGSSAGFIQFEMCKNLSDSESKYGPSEGYHAFDTRCESKKKIN